MLRRISDWLDRRTGHRALVRAALDEPVPGGSRWAYVFGSALLVLFAAQAVTGIALAAHYSPSTTDAWASVSYIQTELYLGWLLRGLHHFGASAMVVVLALHLLQTVWYGAYHAPREVNWLFGIVLLHLTLALALTGYLLPWDQKGYWATQVATSIIGTVPWLGQGLKELLQGGSDYGNLTLTRFYALHVLVLPACLVAFAVGHVFLFRRHGVTVHPDRGEDEVRRATEPFAPGQLFKDAAFALGVLAITFALAVAAGGAPLEAPADPASQYVARPEWYFLPLFELLKYFEGPLEVVGTVVLPMAALTVLTLLPLLHWALGRRLMPRKVTRILAVAVTAGIVAATGLGVSASLADASSKELGGMRTEADRAAREALRLARTGVPVAGPLELYRNDPVVWGRRVYKEKCEQCHHPCSDNPYKGDVCLEGYASRVWLTKLMKNPQARHFFGNTGIDEMDAWSGTDEDLEALVEFVYSQAEREDVNSDLATRGRQVYAESGCDSCHSLDGIGTGNAPDLLGYASEGWLKAFVRAPDAQRFYGALNKMEPFDEKELSDDELQAVVAYLRSQAFAQVPIP